MSCLFSLMLIILKMWSKRKQIAFRRKVLENKGMRWRQGLMALYGVVAVFAIVLAPSVFAAESSSTNYGVDRVFFGAGGELEACSATYCAKQSAGEIAAGNIAGTAFRANAGFNVEREPYIAFSVAGGPEDLGYLSTAGMSYTTGTFAVKTYLANGYAVRIASDPPTNTANPTQQINPLATPAAPQVGVEQFGVNLVANTTGCGMPADFGADPVQVPDNTFSFGTVEADYGTCGLFKYVKGDTIASSSQSTGETDYTVSFIYNIDQLTADGQYSFNATFVATSTY